MSIAVIIPCLNEAASVAKVVADCRRFLPQAEVYVLDNGSADETVANARSAGAHVIRSPLRGKGHVVRHAFRVVDADYLLLIDGDGTYPVDEAYRLLTLAEEQGYEMVTGSRLLHGKPEAFRPMHYAGNRALTYLVRLLFGFPLQDLLTGYRVFSRRFAREMHLTSGGFEVETELTIRAIAQNLSFCEVPVAYTERGENSHSKLRTFRDGWYILLMILRLHKNYKPLVFYPALAGLSLLVALMSPPLFANTLSVLAALLFAAGLVLDSLSSKERARSRDMNESSSTSADSNKKSA